MEENLANTSSLIIVIKKALLTTFKHQELLSKMELLRGRTGHWKIWQGQ